MWDYASSDDTQRSSTDKSRKARDGGSSLCRSKTPCSRSTIQCRNLSNQRLKKHISTSCSLHFCSMYEQCQG